MRMWGVLGLFLVMGMIVASPAPGFAQVSVMTGTVIDAAGGVLPGVTLTSTNLTAVYRTLVMLVETTTSTAGSNAHDNLAYQPRISQLGFRTSVLMDTTVQ